jgi:hypothetical protein
MAEPTERAQLIHGRTAHAEGVGDIPNAEKPRSSALTAAPKTL